MTALPPSTPRQNVAAAPVKGTPRSDDVDSDDELARRWSDSIPVLFVNGRLFAKVRLPKLATRLRLLRAAAGDEGASR